MSYSMRRPNPPPPWQDEYYDRSSANHYRHDFPDEHHDYVPASAPHPYPAQPNSTNHAKGRPARTVYSPGYLSPTPGVANDCSQRPRTTKNFNTKSRSAARDIPQYRPPYVCDEEDEAEDFYVEPQKEHGHKTRRYVSFDLPPLDDPNNSFFTHVQDCTYRSYIGDFSTAKPTAHLRFVDELCTSTSKKLAQLGQTYMRFLPDVMSFLHDSKSTDKAWKAHQQVLLEEARLHLLNEVEDEIHDCEQHDHHRILRRLSAFKDVIKEMMTAISFAQQPQCASENDAAPAPGQSTNIRATKYRAPVQGSASSDSCPSPVPAVLSDEEESLARKLHDALIRAEEAQRNSTTDEISPDPELYIRQAHQYQLKLEILNSLEDRYRDIYYPEVTSFLHDKVSCTFETWSTVQQGLVQKLERNVLDRLAGVTWKILNSSDAARVSKLASAVNKSISKLETTGLALRQWTDRNCAEKAEEDRSRHKARTSNQPVRDMDPSDDPSFLQNQRDAGQLPTLRSAFLAGLRDGLPSQPKSKSSRKQGSSSAHVSSESDFSDVERLRLLKSLWGQKWRPAIKDFIDDLPDDVEDLCSQRDELYASIDKDILIPLQSLSLSDTPRSSLKGFDGFKSHVVDQVRKMIEACADHVDEDRIEAANNTRPISKKSAAAKQNKSKPDAYGDRSVVSKENLTNAELGDARLLYQISEVYYNELQPLLTLLIDNPPEDSRELRARRDHLLKAIDKRVLQPLKSHRWVDRPGKSREDWNNFFGLVANQRDYLIEKCRDYLD